MSILQFDFRDLFFEMTEISYRRKMKVRDNLDIKNANRARPSKRLTHNDYLSQSFCKQVLPFMQFTLSCTTEELMHVFKRFCNYYFFVGSEDVIPRQFDVKDIEQLQGYMI